MERISPTSDANELAQILRQDCFDRRFIFQVHLAFFLRVSSWQSSVSSWCRPDAGLAQMHCPFLKPNGVNIHHCEASSWAKPKRYFRFVSLQGVHNAPDVFVLASELVMWP